MFLSPIKFPEMTNEVKYLTFVMFHGFFLQKIPKQSINYTLALILRIYYHILLNFKGTINV